MDPLEERDLTGLPGHLLLRKKSVLAVITILVVAASLMVGSPLLGSGNTQQRTHLVPLSSDGTPTQAGDTFSDIDRAALAATRALASARLLDPTNIYFQLSGGSQKGNRNWTVNFIPMRCEVTAEQEKCQRIGQGTVRLVVGRIASNLVIQRMSEGPQTQWQHEQVEQYEESAANRRDRFVFPVVDIQPPRESEPSERQVTMVRGIALWEGALGVGYQSECRLTTRDEEGNVLHSGFPFRLDAPSEQSSRLGPFLSEGIPREISGHSTFECREITGFWQPVGDATVEYAGNFAFLRAVAIWSGHLSLRSKSLCEAVAFDSSGASIGHGRFENPGPSEVSDGSISREGEIFVRVELDEGSEVASASITCS